MNDDPHPKLFISYSWDNQENNDHKNWVARLATNLMHHGVDVILDQWNARLGNDLSYFMEQGLTKSQLVLCICSESYVQKANSGKGGVGYEKRILSEDLITGSNKNFIIPIIRNNTKKVLPIFLSGIKYADFTDDTKYYDNYRELLERIYDEDLKLRPKLGNNPFKSTVISDQITLDLAIQQVEFNNPLLEGTIEFDYKRNSGKYIIGNGLYLFTIGFSECGCNSIYCYRDYIKRIGYNPDFTELPEYSELSNCDFTSRCKSLKVGEVLVLENQYHKFASIKILEVKKNDRDIGHLVKFKYKIYEF